MYHPEAPERRLYLGYLRLVWDGHVYPLLWANSLLQVPDDVVIIVDEF